MIRVIAFSVLAAQALGATIAVPDDYPSIAMAVAVADSGDVVSVTGGPYYEWDIILPDGVTVSAPGFGSVVVDALGQGRHFYLNTVGGTHTIEGLELTGASTSYAGGCIQSGSSEVELNLRGCVFRDNDVSASGGGVYVYGRQSTVHISDSLFIGNSASGGGAIYMNGQHSWSQLIIEGTTFRGNSSNQFDGGALNLVDGVSGYFNMVSFRDNESGESGGAISTAGNCDLEFHRCFFEGNHGDVGDDFRIYDAAVAVHRSDFVGGVNVVESDGSLALICCSFTAGADPSSWGPNVLIINEGCDPTSIHDPIAQPNLDAPQASPNPFNPTTTIEYSVSRSGHVRLGIVDVKGRLVSMLVDGFVQPGRHEIVWHGRDSSGREMPSGVYLTRLESNGQVAHGRMTLVR